MLPATSVRDRGIAGTSRTDSKRFADECTSKHDGAGVKQHALHAHFHSLVTDHPILFPADRLPSPVRQKPSPGLSLIPEQSSHT
jgi:hypothetical protein